MKPPARIAATFNRSGAVRSNVVGAAAMPAVSRGPKGSGAPAAKLLSLLAISLVALFATAAPALAAPPTTTCCTTSSVAYTSVHLTGTVTTDGSGVLGFTAYAFQYSTDETEEKNWTTGFESGFETHIKGPATDKQVEATISVPKGGTKYYVRLNAENATFGGPVTESTSPEPNTSFTTLAVDPPTLPGAVEASEVLSISAKANGEVKRPANSDPAFDVNCHFDYITDAQFLANEGNGDPGFTGAQPIDCVENTITADKVDGEGKQKVSAPLADLKPATTYHLRLLAENAAPGVVAKDAATFTTPTIAKPTVTAIDGASEIGSNSAKLTGKVLRPDGTDPGLNTNCHFDYITDAQFTANEGAGDPGFTGAQPIDCVENPITSNGETTVSAKAGLKATTTYHFRLVAENAGGSDAKDAAATFTTPAPELPTVTIDPVAGGTYTTAHVSGTVDIDDPGRGSASTLWGIEVSTDGGQSWPGLLATFYRSLAGTPGPNVVERNFTGLQPNTTYTFRLASTYSTDFGAAEANGEVAYSSAETITTEPATPPTAEDLAVTAIAPTSAHFSATVDPHAPPGPLSALGKKAFATHWEFVCTPECKDANGNEIGGTVQGEEGAKTVTGDAKRLDPNTEYEVRLLVSNEGGGETKVQTFNTPLIKPTIKVAPGGSDGKGGYTLQAVVNPNGSNVSSCEFKWGPNSASYAFSAPCSPPPGDKAQPVTVEAHLTGLNPGVVYNYNLFATNAAGTSESGNREFTPTLDPPEDCPNAQLRKENNSLVLPECRAYEMVSPPGKEGFDASLRTYDGGNRVLYVSSAGNIAKSGQGTFALNYYVATRTAAGWETIPNLNGSSGSLFDVPSKFTKYGAFPQIYSEDLLSSLWGGQRIGDPQGFYPSGAPIPNIYLRNPDGTFTLIDAILLFQVAASSDFSHVLLWRGFEDPFPYGAGIFEFVGTPDYPDQPRRVDVDNTGSPISTCGLAKPSGTPISSDGRVIIFSVAGGCGGDNPPADELWARVNGTTAIDVSASHCSRLDCNAPADTTFAAATPDASRVFFTTTQQLLDADTDQTNDIYACDLPSGNPAPTADKANHCAAFRQVSDAQTGAAVESVGATSENGATVLFTAKGKLADNEDALKEKAVAGDHNLYVWRTDASHPDGQTAFVGRLVSNDLVALQGRAGPQVTPDGRYLVFTTASQLLDTDTDSARDVYRYDADTGDLTRASTNVFGVAGNGDFEARISAPAERHPTAAISDDGTKIVFTTAEPLKLAVDNNDEPDVYLWTPERVSLISTGAVGAGGGGAYVTASGHDIYFATTGALTPPDGDDVADVYDARIGGGFSFVEREPCLGEDCQPPSSGSPAVPAPATTQLPADPGNVKSKTCPKSKVLRKGHCVKKKPKKHRKKHHGKKASHKQGSGK